MRVDELSDEVLLYEYEDMVDEMHSSPLGVSDVDGAYMERLIAELLYWLATDEFDAQ